MESCFSTGFGARHPRGKESAERLCRMSYHDASPGWRNWQTHGT
jgi:hypothetical protein